ncbi:rhodanese family protein [Sphingobium fluviale]|uniref:rhodanese family protein n=1 Tax=Sphingobium fluviale TaxID=2506423 RepID=UPI003CCC7BD1
MPALSPAEARRLIDGGATLVDIRDVEEHAREHIPGALNVTLDRLCELPAGPLVFHCRTGMRTQKNAQALGAARSGAQVHILAGGIDAWRSAGLPTSIDARQPLEIMRQVQIAAGGLVLIGVLLGFLVSPSFFGLSALVGSGLIMAGATGWCGMASLLQAMPWNHRTPTA